MRRRQIETTYRGLVALTVAAVLALPGFAVAAVWTGEWRYLIPAGLAALYLWRLVS